MCEVASFPEITIRLRIDEARRVGDLSIDIPLAETIRFRRKVRDAVRTYDASRTLQGQPPMTPLARAILVSTPFAIALWLVIYLLILVVPF